MTEDGCVTVEPSDDFLETMAQLEERSVRRTRIAGAAATFFFFSAGALVALIAWAMGRIGGDLRSHLKRPRSIRDVQIERSTAGGVRVVLPGAGPQRITMEWERGEIDQEEAAALMAVYDRYRQFPLPR